MGVLNLDRSPSLAEEDIVLFENSVGRFFEEKAPESRVARWREDGIVERAFWTESAEAGLACLSIPEEYGGMGGDYRHEVILMEQLGAKGVDGFGLSLHNAIVAPYILHCGTEEQKQRWLPRMATCELVSAIAMTEPGAGSDLQGIKTTARLDGNEYVINGSKTFITNGQTANLIIVVCKPTRPRARAAPRCWWSRPTRSRASSAAATSTSWARRRPIRRSCSSMTCGFPRPTCWAPARARASSS